MGYTNDYLELDARRAEALRYVERGKLIAEYLLDEYFDHTAVSEDPRMMAAYFNNARIMASAVHDYCHRALKVLEGKQDTESQGGAPA